MPLLGDPAKTALSIAHSQGAESADATNGDGNRCAFGEQIAFQEIVRWGRGNPTRSDCTLWKNHFPASCNQPRIPTNQPCSHAAQRQNQGSPAHQRVPASSSDSHEQSHILSPWGTSTGEKVDLPPTLLHPCCFLGLGLLANPGHEPSLCRLVSHRSAHFFPLLLKPRKHGAAKRTLRVSQKWALKCPQGGKNLHRERGFVVFV